MTKRLNIYNVKYITPYGRTVTVKIKASDKVDARYRLRKQVNNIVVLSVRQILIWRHIKKFNSNKI